MNQVYHLNLLQLPVYLQHPLWTKCSCTVNGTSSDTSKGETIHKRDDEDNDDTSKTPTPTLAATRLDSETMSLLPPEDNHHMNSIQSEATSMNANDKREERKETQQEQKSHHGDDDTHNDTSSTPILEKNVTFENPFSRHEEQKEAQKEHISDTVESHNEEDDTLENSLEDVFPDMKKMKRTAKNHLKRKDMMMMMMKKKKNMRKRKRNEKGSSINIIHTIRLSSMNPDTGDTDATSTMNDKNANHAKNQLPFHQVTPDTNSFTETTVARHPSKHKRFQSQLNIDILNREGGMVNLGGVYDDYSLDYEQEEQKDQSLEDSLEFFSTIHEDQGESNRHE